MVNATVAVIVDPYRFYGTPTIAGWTALKPRIYQEVDLAKSLQLERIKPRTLLLGNSRVEIGRAPQSPEWPSDLAPIFNAAEPGRSLFTAVLMLRDALAVGPVSTAVVGVDFQDFAEGPSPPSRLPSLGSAEKRMLVDRDGRANPGRWFQLLKDWARVTLTASALYDSLSTLADQNSDFTSTMTLLGFNPLREYRLFVRRSGYHALFAQWSAENERAYRARPIPEFHDLASQESFRYLRELLEIAATHRVHVILYTQPYHSDYLEMLHQLCFWDSFEDWKRALVRVVAEYSNSSDIQLYDFADYNDVTTEPVPPEGDTHSEMRWYWEAGHYKSALGNEILPTIFGQGTLGRRLDPENIEQVLASVREHRTRFVLNLHSDMACPRKGN
jgi:hypothetical protein